MILPSASSRRPPAPLRTPQASLVAIDAGPDDIARLDRYTLRSAVLPDPPSRVVSIYLPEIYASATERRFPVFYLQDGQNLFDPRTSYIAGHTWQAGTTADRLTAAGEITPVILVGIANTGLRRMSEYTPTRDPRLGGGDGASYGALIRKELKPWVDATYRTLPGPAETALGGSSLGGLISLYLGLTSPQIFGGLAVLSPSLWWNHRAILPLVQRAAAALGTTPRPRIWLDIGTAEGAPHVRDTEMLHRLLQQAGWRDHVDLALDVVTNGVHNEDAWAARFDQVLRFLFPSRST